MDFGNVVVTLRKIGKIYQTDVVKKLADVLETTAGYLLGKTQERELLKDPSMLKRLNDIAKFSQKDKEHILYTLDAMINNVKLKAI